MPTLTDPRAEAFAQHRARGANVEDAYELAGFAGGQGHASRFAKRRKVAARVRELIEAGRRQPITGQDIAFELQRMVQNFDDFDTPQRMRETRETLMELRKVQVELERERYVERERERRNTPPQARTSPNPPVSAWSLPSAARAEVPPLPRPAALVAWPRADALALAASPLAIGAAQERGRPVRVLRPQKWRTRRPPSGPGEVGARRFAA
jgi:hypothetical protein